MHFNDANKWSRMIKHPTLNANTQTYKVFYLSSHSKEKEEEKRR